VLYVVAMIAVIVGVDFVFFRNRFPRASMNRSGPGCNRQHKKMAPTIEGQGQANLGGLGGLSDRLVGRYVPR
jgi:hypothetical protein